MIINYFHNKYRLIKQEHKAIIILVFFSMFLFFLLDKYWISSDEYFYVDLGRSIAASYNGNGCLNCIDSAHTPLLPFIISLGYHFFDIDSIMFYRIIPTIFAIATLYVLYKIAEVAYGKKKEALFVFVLVLLFPGFFTFSNKIYLDIVALFFIALAIYWLLKKDKYWKISLALLLVFLSKEYLVFPPSVVVFLVIIIDALKKKEASFLNRIKEVVVNITTIFFPLILLITLFVATELLPYPRMLDNLLIEVFGLTYWSIAALLKHEISESVFVGKVGDMINSVIQLNIVNIINEASIWQKIKDIYLSSYKEADVNILAIPLMLVGLTARIKLIFLSFKKNYNKVRNDLIFITFLLIVSYFNYRVSSGDHGFRIIMPLMIPFIYFIYWGFKELIEKKNYWTKFSFGVLSFLFIFFYFQANKMGFSYSSVISGNILVAAFLKYKLYVNIIMYVFFACLILVYYRLRIKWKSLLLLATLIFMCLYKILPFAVDKYFANKTYGDDYNLILARPYLEKIEGLMPIIMTNEIPYAYYYYANSVKLPNENKPDLPVLRKKSEITYSNRVIDLKKNDISVDYICQKNIDYIFYVNTNKDNLMLNDAIAAIPLLSAIAEYKLPQNKRFNWGLFKVDKSFCNQ